MLRAGTGACSNTGTFHHGSGGGAGKANFQDISVTKYVDTASADLMLCLRNGKHIAKGKIIVRKAGENPLEYLTIRDRRTSWSPRSRPAAAAARSASPRT